MYFGIFQSVGDIVLCETQLSHFWLMETCSIWLLSVWQDPTSSWLLTLYLLSNLTRLFTLSYIFPVSVLESHFSKKSSWMVFSGKLNFRIKVWMVGMFIYLGLVIVLGILIKLIMLAEWNIQKYICLNVYISKSNVSWGFILIFSNQFKYDRILLNLSSRT